MTTKTSILSDGAVPGMILPALAKWCAEESRAFADDESPFSMSVTDGDPRVLLIVGENASGKSLAFRLLAQVAQSEGILPVTISIRERTGGGTHGMERMRQAMMFGDEIERSTGANSASVVARGFSNAEREQPAILGLDEPEIGLSEGYAEALGEMIGSNALKLGGMCCGVMVVTHSRRLARGLRAGLGNDPTLVTMSATPLTMDDWLASDEKRSIEELLALPTIGMERFRAVQKLLQSKD